MHTGQHRHSSQFITVFLPLLFFYIWFQSWFSGFLVSYSFSQFSKTAVVLCWSFIVFHSVRKHPPVLLSPFNAVKTKDEPSCLTVAAHLYVLAAQTCSCFCDAPWTCTDVFVRSTAKYNNQKASCIYLCTWETLRLFLFYISGCDLQDSWVIPESLSSPRPTPSVTQSVLVWTSLQLHPPADTPTAERREDVLQHVAFHTFTDLSERCRNFI